jgi:hypothetical protein
MSSIKMDQSNLSFLSKFVRIFLGYLYRRFIKMLASSFFISINLIVLSIISNILFKTNTLNFLINREYPLRVRGFDYFYL